MVVKKILLKINVCVYKILNSKRKIYIKKKKEMRIQRFEENVSKVF